MREPLVWLALVAADAGGLDEPDLFELAPEARGEGLIPAALVDAMASWDARPTCGSRAGFARDPVLDQSLIRRLGLGGELLLTSVLDARGEDPAACAPLSLRSEQELEPPERLADE